MLNVLIIEDEENAVQELTRILDSLERDISILGSAQSIQEGVEKINTLQPDLVFLDIELKDGLAFDILKSPELRHHFQIIFVTAHNEHAIKAFEHSAVDYLLKPIEKSKLFLAVNRALTKKNDQENNEKIEFMLRSLQNKQFAKIAIPTLEGFELINKDEILCCEAESNYTVIHLLNKKIITSKVLKKMEGLLFESNFCRVHKSFIVNVNFIKKVHKVDGGKIIMENNMEIPVARRRKDEFLSLLGM